MGDTPDKIGRWDDLFDISNVAAHAHLLPDGNRILYWGRRANPKETTQPSMSEHETKAFILDLTTGRSTRSLGPGVLDKTNLFCSGHCWMPDGKLIVFGGHIQDGVGSNQVCIFDPAATDGNQWTSIGPMVAGRWYPTAICLPDGSVLCISGSQEGFHPVVTPIIWRNKQFESVINHDSLSLYPQLQLDSNGRVFMSGPQAQSFFLNLARNDNTQNPVLGGWDTDADRLTRAGRLRDYAATAMFDAGQLIYMGGGNERLLQDTGDPTGPPTNLVEFVNLNETPPKWTTMPPMNWPRRQHNATVLPNGTVGGTQGNGFNNVKKDQPVHKAELFVPKDNIWNTAKKDQWVKMAAESEDRCYHGVALLLPDGRVFSSGSGEWSPNNDFWPNDPNDSKTNAQFYSPPYLCLGGVRPVVSNAPKTVDYNGKIEVTISNFDTVMLISWIRIGSVTHSNNMSQSRRTLTIDSNQNGKLRINAPTSSNDCPPGHYMLFVLDSRGVPAVAPIIVLNPFPRADVKSVGPPVAVPIVAAIATAVTRPLARVAAEPAGHVSLHTLDEEMAQNKLEKDQPYVTVGITTVCPYGLGPCWGGAHEGLHEIKDVEAVRPKPSQEDSAAYVYLHEDIIPDIDVWRSDFASFVNGTYTIRGIEMTLSGKVSKEQAEHGEQLVLAGVSPRPDLPLAPLQAGSKVQWDRLTKAPQSLTDVEISAYERLVKALTENPEITVKVTGPLMKKGGGQYTLEVREFEPLA